MRPRRLSLAKSRKQQPASSTRSMGASMRSLADSGKTDKSWKIDVPDCASLLCAPSLQSVASAHTSASVSRADSEQGGANTCALGNDAAHASARVHPDTNSVLRTVQRTVSCSTARPVAVKLVLDRGSELSSCVRLNLQLR